MLEMMYTLEQIQEAAKSAGLDPEAVEKMSSLLSANLAQESALTVVCNEGVHPIPKDKLPGKVFSATVGNMPDQTLEELQQSISEACRRLSQLIKSEGPFSEIFLVPSGYGVLLQKLAETVFQITGQPATTLHFDRNSKTYWPVRIDLRSIIAQSE